jgi:vacuolar-type H+-ATPase subunit H
VIKIDIVFLIERLETLVDEGWRIPLTSKIIINEDRYWDIVERMRASIPEDIKRAQTIEQERDRIIAQANEEAGRIIALARERAKELVANHEITKGAEERAEMLLERARQEAETFKADADDYVIEVLTKLEAELFDLLTTVRNGIMKIQRDRETAEERRA